MTTALVTAAVLFTLILAAALAWPRARPTGPRLMNPMPAGWVPAAGDLVADRPELDGVGGDACACRGGVRMSSHSETGETAQRCDHVWDVVWDAGGTYSATDCCRRCGEYRTGWGCPAVYGAHEWIDRPESDTRECGICGMEVAG